MRNIAYHNDRCYRTRLAFYDDAKKINLREYIFDVPDIPLIKCRIIYDSKIKKVEYQPYTISKIQSLKLIVNNDVQYQYKDTQRTILSKIFEQKQSCDDVLIVKNGLITDTYYANVALSSNDVWYTPAEPLLYGTMRAYLIDRKKIVPKKINADDLRFYDQICIFNAMIPFGRIVMPIKNVDR